MYIEILIKDLSEADKEILIANLSELAEGFEETENTFKIYIKQEKFDTTEIKVLSEKLQFSYQIASIPNQNWNQLWESNFDPVIVNDFVAVRADFHQSEKNVEHEIVITPKMSFGTGHHATTFLMMQQMRKIDFTGKSVFDFGTGTGILAILAYKLGASRILATDIDEWSINNAQENFERNAISQIVLKQSDSAIQNETFDIILANINRNILIETIPDLAKQLQKGGVLLLSGLLAVDEPDILSVCDNNALVLKESVQKEKWICLYFNKL
ncbi:MAG: 50S ribosomal protein L11 methyltransferase [Chitinophagaceae bacterium]|mgnify:CR=1 FL=1|jgi:ribosomal protein L11 methyltransferase|nr:50S ribosomal protein L11 methyltransferase [Chitinophagaceae bacterium]HRN49444.1 50S ribosomal protein L11 methyltransferase [Niabella sp.]